MKRYVILSLTCLMALSVMAQYPYGGRRYSQPPVVVRTETRNPGPGHRFGWNGPAWNSTYFGFRLGLNAASVRSSAPALDGKSAKTGLNVGLAVGLPLSRYNPIFIETGLLFNQKGGKSSASGTRGKFTYDLGYLELPLVLKYKFYTRSGVAIEPFAGGFMAVGVSGEIKDYADREAFSSYSDNYFRRFDGGLRLGCGVSYGMGYLEMGYDLGLANVGQDTFDDTHTGCFTIGIGVNF